jgi:hypothetical protein
MKDTLVIPIQSDQTLTLVKAPDGAVTARVAKAGHNRAVAKLTVAQRAAVAEFLS